jgi:hypothetical protein
MWARVAGAALVLACAAVACGRTGLFVLPSQEAGVDAGATQDASRVEADAPASTASDVRGQVVVHYSTDTGVVDQGFDLTMTEIVAYAELGDGGFDEVAGSGSADGTFVVPQVPEGAFDLRIGTTVLVHPGRNVVVPFYAAGRPDAVPQYMGATGRLDIDNVAPWQSTFPDYVFALLVFSSNSATVGILGGSFGSQTGEGATSIQATEVAMTLDNSTIDSTRGDHATFVQFNARNPDGGLGTEQYFVRSMELPDPMFGGGLPPFSIAGSLQTVAPTGAVPTAWDGPAFLSYVPRLAPSATKTTRGLSVQALANTQPPGISLPVQLPMRPRFFGWGLVGLGVDAQETQFPSTLSFGNPFPSWSQWVYAVLDVTTTLTATDLDGGSFSVVATSGFARLTPIAAFGPGPLEPTLTPPGDVRIDGADALSTLPPVGATPTFTWTAATSLDPAFDNGRIAYLIELTPITALAGVSSYLFSTDETHVTVPPDLLQPGVRYYASVEALASPGADPANPAYDTATVTTATFAR